MTGDMQNPCRGQAPTFRVVNNLIQANLGEFPLHITKEILGRWRIVESNQSMVDQPGKMLFDTGNIRS